MYTFARERNAEKNEKILLKIQQAAANNTVCSSTWYIFLKETSLQKKINNNNRGKKLEKVATVVPGIRITSRTLWTTAKKLEARPAANGRDNEGQMRRSHACFFGLVATCDVRGTCPTQKLPPFFNVIYMGPRKTNIVFRRSPDRGGIVLHEVKKQKKNMTFWISTSMPAEYWYVRTTCHVCAEIPSNP